jgi:hypothetical protein
MLDVKGAEAVSEFRASEFAFDFIGEVIEAATVGLDFKFGEELFHGSVRELRMVLSR